jgi:hypothetical protein
MKAIKKFIKNITYGILTKIIISIVTMAFLSLVTFSHYIQQNQIRKLQNSFGSQRKDLVVNLIINNNNLHKDLLKKLKEQCNDGIYLSYFSSDEQKGTWIALVSNHQMLSEQARFIATHLDTLTKDPIQLEALHNLTNVAYLAENIVKRQDFNPIYTETYNFSLGGIDPTSQGYFYSLPSFKPKKISPEEIQNYNFLRYIFGNIMLGKYNINTEAQVYIYSLYKPEVNRIRFVTLFFTNTNNNCIEQDKMKKLFDDTYQILDSYNV